MEGFFCGICGKMISFMTSFGWLTVRAEGYWRNRSRFTTGVEIGGPATDAKASGSIDHTGRERLLPSLASPWFGRSLTSPSRAMNSLSEVNAMMITGVASLSHGNPWQVIFSLPLA